MSFSSSWKYFAFILVLSLVTIPAYAAPTIQTTSGGTINVGFETNPTSPNPGDQTQLKISFINKQTKEIQVHIDYKIVVMQGDNQIFGIPISHTAEGAVSIPFQFQSAGTYQVIVEVDGIVFQPIPPETAKFSVTVGQPSANTTGNTTGTIKIPNWVKNNARFWYEGSIDDSTFAAGIQYLIQQGVIKIPPTQSGQASQNVKIPNWVKNNAGFWSRGEIDDATFVNGIQWLITNGIIHV